MTVTIRRKTLGVILAANAMVLLGLVAADAVVLAKVDNAAGNIASLQRTYHADQVAANKRLAKEQAESVKYVHGLIVEIETTIDQSTRAEVAAAVREIERKDPR